MWQFVPVQTLTGPPSCRYADRPLPGGTAKINHRRSISAVDGRLREKSTIGGQLREKSSRLREKKGRRRGKEKKKKRRRKPSACPRPRTVVALARCSLARRRPRIAHARRCSVFSRGEKDRDVKRWVHKSKYYLDIYWFMMK
ncbi:hypothetical protein GW17_00040424 [Ensete ventricosum]|nr:hypothetical protein GW17_00040424 [Ensete ventricosum]